MLQGRQHIYNLSALIKLSQSLEATDLRDKVYGILGILPLPIQDKIEVNVEKSIVTVYADFTRALLEYGEELKFFEVVGISKSVIANLPSWSIDLSQKERIERITSILTDFRAGRSKSLLPCIEHFDANSSRPLLTILGWKADCVTEVVQDLRYWSRNLWDTETSEAANKLEEACLQMSRTIFNTPDDIPDEYWKTITAERGRDGQKSRREEYLEWKQSIAAMAKREPSLHKQGDHSLPSPPRALWSVFNEDVAFTCNGNTFYSTEGGRIGIGPPGTKTGDFVCIPCQSQIPFIMRKNDANGRYILIGGTYCSGVMDGEIFDMGEELKAMEARFVIE
jgi:hypothetical protein